MDKIDCDFCRKPARYVAQLEEVFGGNLCKDHLEIMIYSRKMCAVFNALVDNDVEIDDIVKYLHKKYDGIIVGSFLESIGVETN